MVLVVYPIHDDITSHQKDISTNGDIIDRWVTIRPKV